MPLLVLSAKDTPAGLSGNSCENTPHLCAVWTAETVNTPDILTADVLGLDAPISNKGEWLQHNQNSSANVWLTHWGPVPFPSQQLGNLISANLRSSTIVLPKMTKVCSTFPPCPKDMAVVRSTVAANCPTYACMVNWSKDEENGLQGNWIGPWG